MIKPVLVFRHARTEGAGYFGTFLERNGIPWCEVRIDLGHALPNSVRDFSGLVLMGGPMSVNDDLPWIPPLLNLIREAIAHDVPVLGHCLGGQLMSKALGGVVSANPVKEIGWGDVLVTDNLMAKQWFGDVKKFASFHWHGETFTLPNGATHILASPYCTNQAWTIDKHLAFQCHIEMTEEMIKVWYETGQDEVLASSSSPAVQTFEQVKESIQERVLRLNQLAEKVYSQWIKGLNPS